MSDRTREYPRLRRAVGIWRGVRPEKLSRLAAGDAHLPVKFQHNEFARSRVGWRGKKFCHGLGDLEGHKAYLAFGLLWFASLSA